MCEHMCVYLCGRCGEVGRSRPVPTNMDRMCCEQMLSPLSHLSTLTLDKMGASGGSGESMT